MAVKSWQVLVRQLLFSLTYHFDVIVTECNVCQSNQAACINSTSFYLCFGENAPDTETLYHCKDGFECTDLQAICVQKNNARPPSCGDTSQCGMCSANRNHVFACLSRTTFQMCYGALRPVGQVGYCPEGTICDANSDDFCVSLTKPHKITCDVVNGSPTTVPTTVPTTQWPPSTQTTVTQPTTSTPSYPLTPNEVCAQRREVGLFPTMPHDPYCRRYVACYYSDGVIRGIEYTCSGSSYFNIEDETCTLNKPAYCI